MVKVSAFVAKISYYGELLLTLTKIFSEIYEYFQRLANEADETASDVKPQEPTGSVRTSNEGAASKVQTFKFGSSNVSNKFKFGSSNVSNTHDALKQQKVPEKV